MPLATRDPIVIGTSFESLIEKVNLLLGNLDSNIEAIVGQMVSSPASDQNGITVAYDSINKVLDFDVTGGGGGDQEEIEDTVADMFVHGGHTGINVSYNDTDGLITLSVVDNFVNTTGDTMTGNLSLAGTARLLKTQVSSFATSTDVNDAGMVIGPNVSTGLAIGRDAIKTNGGLLVIGSISAHDVYAVRANTEYWRLNADGILISKNSIVNDSSIAFRRSNTAIGSVLCTTQAVEIVAAPGRFVNLRGSQGNCPITTNVVSGVDVADLNWGVNSRLRTTSYGLDVFGSRISNVATPVSGGDAVNKDYVTSMVPTFGFKTSGSNAITLVPTRNAWVTIDASARVPVGATMAIVSMWHFVRESSGIKDSFARTQAGSPELLVGRCWQSDGDEDGSFNTFYIPLTAARTFQLFIGTGSDESGYVVQGYVSGVNVLNY